MCEPVSTLAIMSKVLGGVAAARSIEQANDPDIQEPATPTQPQRQPQMRRRRPPGSAGGNYGASGASFDMLNTGQPTLLGS